MAYKLENNEKVRDLEADLQSLQTQLSTVDEKLALSTKELSREKAKNKSVSKHTEVN